MRNWWGTGGEPVPPLIKKKLKEVKIKEKEKEVKGKGSLKEKPNGVNPEPPFSNFTKQKTATTEK